MSPVSTVKKQHQIDGTQLAKTRLCLFYQEGRCKYGSECTYAHYVDEVRKAPEELRRTKLCELFMDPTRGCVDPDCNFAHDSAELRSKKDARRKARASLRSTPSPSLREGGGPRLSQVSSDALELMQQLAALLAAVQHEDAPSSLLNFLPEEEEHLTGLSEILGPRELSPPGSKRDSLASTAAGTPLGASRHSFSLF